MKLIKVTCAASMLLCTGLINAKAEFKGNLVLIPSDCKEKGSCELAEPFGYIDKSQQGWEAQKGDVTDGATIPGWAQRFVGVPFTESYIPAAVLHDHYSKSVRPVYGWLETQLMFYEVLKVSGVDEPLASSLLLGVLVGSGKWITRVKGSQCNLIRENCMTQVSEETLERDPPSFDTPEYKEIFLRLKEEIESRGITGADAIIALVKRERPNDKYLNNPSGIIKDGFVVESAPYQ